MRTAKLVFGMFLVAALAAGAISCGGGSAKTTSTNSSPPATKAATAGVTPKSSPETAITSATTTGGGSTVSVNLVEYKVAPDRASVPAGHVTFTVKNIGGETHELVLVKTDLAESALPTKADGSLDESGAGVTVIDETGDLAVGNQHTLTADLVPGKYMLVSNIVETKNGQTHVHYSLGMHTAMEVTQ